MAIEHYKTGVSSMGMDEWTSEYICDWPDCKQAAEYDGYCEQHFCAIEAARERDDDDV